MASAVPRGALAYAGTDSSPEGGAVTQGTRTEQSEEAPRSDGRAGRRVRLAAVSSLIVVVLVGAGGFLWLSARGAGQERLANQVEPPPEPPIRLDTLPPPRENPRRTRTRTSAKAAPVIGVGTGEFSGEKKERPSAATIDVDGRKPSAERASDAEIRQQLAALERENARIEAALRRASGPVSGTGELIWPVRGPVTSPFGQRWGRLHAGIDIGAGTGTPVRASDSGRVVVSGSVGGYGNYICIQHTGSLSTCYAHNSRLGVRKGDSARKGQVIARSGCTGHCYGPHVHFEVRVGGRPVNPMRYL